jgi:hypothetical protein
MSTPAEYREWAAECLQAMQLATVAEVKTALLEMAQRWTELAERFERNAHVQATDHTSLGSPTCDSAAWSESL